MDAGTYTISALFLVAVYVAILGTLGGLANELENTTKGTKAYSRIRTSAYVVAGVFCTICIPLFGVFAYNVMTSH